MKVLAQTDLSILPGPGDYTASPAGMITVGKYVIHAVSVWDADFTQATAVLRSLLVTPTGVRVVDTLRVQVATSSGDLPLSMNRLDDSRFFVVVNSDTYRPNDADLVITAFVVGCNSDGTLIQGVPVQHTRQVSVPGDPFYATRYITYSLHTPMPTVATGPAQAVLFTTVNSSPTYASGSVYATVSARFDISGLTVAAPVWELWQTGWQTPTFAFQHDGVAYMVGGNVIFAPGGANAVTDGNGYPIGYSWDLPVGTIFRSVDIAGDTWLFGRDAVVLVATGANPQAVGWSSWSSITSQFSSGVDWNGYASERNTVTAQSTFLMWDFWDSPRMIEVAVPGSYVGDVLDLRPYLPAEISASDFEGGTLAVVGQLALVEVVADHLEVSAVDTWGTGAKYLVIELAALTPPLRMNQRDDGAGMIGHARLQTHGLGRQSSSQQSGVRLGTNNTYL